MKQAITTKQLKELGEIGREKLDKWVFDKYPLEFIKQPLLSIGQMIEFLDEHDEIQIDRNHREPAHWIIESPTNHDLFCSKEELCDALWEAVKEVLNGK